MYKPIFFVYNTINLAEGYLNLLTSLTAKEIEIAAAGLISELTGAIVGYMGGSYFITNGFRNLM